jgi:hypothetical protein
VTLTEIDWEPSNRTDRNVPSDLKARLPNAPS